MKAARKAAERRASTLANKVKAAQKKIQGLEKRLEKAKTPGERQKLRFQLHQKKRRLAILKTRLKAAEEENQRIIPKLCFGGSKLFRAQFHLKENGYTSHGAWLSDWRSARSAQFTFLGSKGETGGNQTATLDGQGGLRIRVPPALEEKFGRWVHIPNVRFPYGQEVLDWARATGQAITFRFLKRRRKGGWRWYLQASTNRPTTPIITDRKNGFLGLDLNPHLVAVTLVDPHGNPLESRHIRIQVQGRRREQVEASLAEAVAQVVKWAKAKKVPIALERLDFTKKKDRLEVLGGKKYARMLSSFAYRKFHSLLRSRAAKGCFARRANTY